MKETQMKTSHITAAALIFCVYIGLVFALLLFLPEKDFSQNEKRYLQEKPELSFETVISGDFGEKAEKYTADHLPARDFFVTVYAHAERFFGLQSEKKISVGASGRLYERAQRRNEKAAKANISAINVFSEKINHKVDLMLVPSAGYVLQDDIQGHYDPFIDGELIDEIYASISDQVHAIDICSLFLNTENRFDLYYGTDHHWTSFGAFCAYKNYMDILGRQHPELSDYRVEEVEGFYGTTYSRACFWEHPSEKIELWHSGGSFTVDLQSEGKHEGLFFYEKLDNDDKYPVFLGGNHPTSTINNSSSKADGKILVICDSFANCFAGFLADSYEMVTLVDLRYYKSPISELVEAEEYDDVLVLYSLNNFLTDANIVWLD